MHAMLGPQAGHDRRSHAGRLGWWPRRPFLTSGVVSIVGAVPDPTFPVRPLSSPVAAESAVSLSQLRRWLRDLGNPHLLNDPALVAVLRRHGRAPSFDSPLAVGHAAEKLIRDCIERLRLPTTAPRHQQLPYLVLKACYVDGRKRSSVGFQLNLSERTLTRERTRALVLLQAELAEGVPPTSGTTTRAEPIPRISGFFGRQAELARLTELAEGNRLLQVSGPAGVGKSCFVAEWVSRIETDRPVVWYQLRQGLNDTLPTFLLDLAGTLSDRLPSEQIGGLVDAVTRGNAGLASRFALQALTDVSLVLVLDNYHHAAADCGFSGFLEEVTARLDAVQVVTVSRRREQDAVTNLALAAFQADEVQQFLEQLRVEAMPALVATLHEWTGGLPQLVKFAAAWLKTATPAEITRGTSALMEADDVQEFLLDSITHLIDPEDRHILAAASVFRDRFTDDALAYVSERSRGQVLDTSRRLVRYYLATRAVDGEVAFFQNSVRDYVHARLSPADRQTFHLRAAILYERAGDSAEANYHRRALEQVAP